MKVIKKSPESVTANIFLDGDPLKTKRSIKYIGAKLSADGRSHEDICNRMSPAKSAFFQMKSLLCNPKLDLGMRFRLWRCYVLPILMYGCDSRIILETDRRKMAALEMWFLRRMLRIKWTSKFSNEEVLVRAGGQRCLLNIIVKRQVQFFEHKMRKQKIEYQVMTEKIIGKKSRGRQRLKFMDQMKAATNCAKTTEVFKRLREWSLMSDDMARKEEVVNFLN